VLVLDEPTNDLDIETLEMLEELLQDYDGTVFLVSHDRRFVDNVVTSTLVAEGDGLWREYEGGISDWQAQSARSKARKTRPRPRPRLPPRRSRRPRPAAAPVARRPSQAQAQLQEQREFDELPGKIEALEAEQAELAALLADSGFYTQAPQRVAEVTQRHAQIEEALMALLERWEDCYQAMRLISPS
jgi:ATP-binding cassette subfamily F protein uup